jgi:hypothetical protein
MLQQRHELDSAGSGQGREEGSCEHGPTNGGRAVSRACERLSASAAGPAGRPEVRVAAPGSSNDTPLNATLSTSAHTSLFGL